jgi:hypothetical protein
MAVVSMRSVPELPILLLGTGDGRMLTLLIGQYNIPKISLIGRNYA